MDVIDEFPQPKPGEFPPRKCREPVFSDSGLGYSCELPLHHMGPCMTYSARHTVENRKVWAEKNPDKAGHTDSPDMIGD